mgnify:FL=1
MGFFRQPTPRRFHHPYIYVDERKERLQQLIARVRNEKASAPSEEARKEALRKAFRESMARATHHRKAAGRGGAFVQIAVVLLLIAVFYFVVFVRA